MIKKSYTEFATPNRQQTMEEILNRYRRNHREDLIPCMQDVQDQAGFLSGEAITGISEYFGLPASKVFGIATFYDYFSFTPVNGDMIRICNGTSCHMQGSDKLIHEAKKVARQISGNTQPKMKISLCECQGACSAGPILQVNQDIYTRVDPEQVTRCIKRSIEKRKEEHHG